MFGEIESIAKIIIERTLLRSQIRWDYSSLIEALRQAAPVV